MNWDLVFILAAPAAVALLIVWMIAAGYARTDGMPSNTAENPYPERFDAFGRWFVGIATAILYGIMLFAAGPFFAAAVLAIFLAIDVVGTLIWTACQEAVGRLGWATLSAPFSTRLFRNFRDFYAALVIGILAYA